jgi:threonine dehydrogenase-like Zn-dependent dehydrogenase
VAFWGGGLYAQFGVAKAADCLVLPEGAKPAAGASCFVNPLTALGFIEAMRREGHTALVHTAAASNLGQMLQKICLKDGIGLVNIIRSAEQAALLRSIGAAYVCDSTASTFRDDLTKAVQETGATLAFDAIGGGPLASQILTCMEIAASRKMTAYSRYGSFVHKHLWRAQHAPDRVKPQLRHGMGRWRMTCLPFPAKDWIAGCSKTARAHRGRADDNLRFALYGGNLPCRGAPSRHHHRLQ